MLVTGAGLVRVHDPKICADMLDVLQKHGHIEIDTARVYGGGSSEEYLGELKWQERGLLMGTKLSPRRFGPKPYTHKKEDLKSGLLESLQALQTEKIDIWYLHAPDVSKLNVLVSIPLNHGRSECWKLRTLNARAAGSHPTTEIYSFF